MYDYFNSKPFERFDNQPRKLVRNARLLIDNLMLLELPADGEGNYTVRRRE